MASDGVAGSGSIAGGGATGPVAGGCWAVGCGAVCVGAGAGLGRRRSWLSGNAALGPGWRGRRRLRLGGRRLSGRRAACHRRRRRDPCAGARLLAHLRLRILRVLRAGRRRRGLLARPELEVRAAAAARSCWFPGPSARPPRTGAPLPRRPRIRLRLPSRYQIRSTPHRAAVQAAARPRWWRKPRLSSPSQWPWPQSGVPVRQIGHNARRSVRRLIAAPPRRAGGGSSALALALAVGTRYGSVALGEPGPLAPDRPDQVA